MRRTLKHLATTRESSWWSGVRIDPSRTAFKEWAGPGRQALWRGLQAGGRVDAGEESGNRGSEQEVERKVCGERNNERWGRKGPGTGIYPAVPCWPEGVHLGGWRGQMCALKTDHGAVLKGVCVWESVCWGRGNGLGKRQGDQMGRKLLWLFTEVMMRTGHQGQWIPERFTR